jgi:hypothetical protein
MLSRSTLRCSPGNGRWRQQSAWSIEDIANFSIKYAERLQEIIGI